MRIVLAVHLAELIGGAEHLLLHLLEGNLQCGSTEYHVVFLHDGPLARMVAGLGYPVQVFEAGEVPEVHKFAYTTARLAAYVERVDPALVMAWKGGSHLYASLAAQLVHRPEIWWQQEIPLGCRSDRILTLMPTRRIFCVSHESATAQMRMQPHRPTTVIYPCIHPSLLAENGLPSVREARSILGLPPERPLVGMIGRLVPRKGADVFLHAAADVASIFPSAMFAVVGGPQQGLSESFAAAVQRLPTELGIAERVLLPGYVSTPALWMQAMDIVVHAASQPEAFGMVIVEAMALGKPVIASDCGGPREIVCSGVNGLLAPAGDVRALAEAICHLLGDPDLARRMGYEARVRAREFQRDRFVARVEAAVAEVV
jgi:glycosyltransferase involved in cell wall biosynthesis